MRIGYELPAILTIVLTPDFLDLDIIDCVKLALAYTVPIENQEPWWQGNTSLWIATTLEPFIQGILPCSGFIRHVNRREPATTYGDHVVEVLYDFEAGLLDSTDRDGILR